MIEIIEMSNPADTSWLEMRGHLWPHLDKISHQKELEHLLVEPSRFIAFLAVHPDGQAIGFAETTVRTDYVNGCDSRPVAFLEGIYVKPEFREIGVAKKLCESVERWGYSQGCTELASDALLNNTISHQMHHKLGFKETERVVYFKKSLAL